METTSLFIAHPSSIINLIDRDDEGNRIQHPHWFELAKQRWNYHYKSMRTPCSCWLCRGEKYSRKEYKKASLRIMKESME